MQGLGIWNNESMNIADRIYQFDNGGQVQFINTDDPDKLRGLKSDILFIDEANEVDEDAYFQLSIRTTGKIILAYNPTISPYHWLRQMQDCERYNTSYGATTILTGVSTQPCFSNSLKSSLSSNIVAS